MSGFTLPTDAGSLLIRFQPTNEHGRLELSASDDNGATTLIGSGPAAEVYHPFRAWLDGCYPDLDKLKSVSDYEQRPWYTTRMHSCFLLDGHTTAIVSVDGPTNIEFLDKKLETIRSYKLSDDFAAVWKTALDHCVTQCAGDDWTGWALTHLRETRAPISPERWRELHLIRSKVKEGMKRVEQSLHQRGGKGPPSTS